MTDSERPEGEVLLNGFWDPSLLAQIAELNLQFLEAVRNAARLEAAPAEAPVVTDLRPLWAALGDDSLQSLARSPYLLLDVGFARVEYWGGAAAGVRDGVPNDVNRQSGHRAPAAESGWLAAAIGPHLMRRTVILAWHLSRANPFAARLTLGMSAGCAAAIAATRLCELELRVEGHLQPVRLRWEQKPAIWRQLLQAALHGRSAQLDTLLMRGFQLLAAESSPAGGTR